MKVMKQVFYILIVFLLAACYDDKGNYDYEEINTITVLLDDGKSTQSSPLNSQ